MSNFSKIIVINIKVWVFKWFLEFGVVGDELFDLDIYVYVLIVWFDVYLKVLICLVFKGFLYERFILRNYDLKLWYEIVIFIYFWFLIVLCLENFIKILV